MANVTFVISDDLKAKMSKFPEINWSEVARQAIAEKARAMETMDRLAARSALTEQQATAAGREIKRRVWKKHRQPG